MLMNCHSLTPALPPVKLQLLPFGQVSLDRIVDTLDDHVLDARASQQVGHGRGVAKWIHWPTGVGLNTWRKEWSRCQGGLQPDHHMAFSAKFTASLSYGFQCKFTISLGYMPELTISFLSSYGDGQFWQVTLFHCFENRRLIITMQAMTQYQAI